jgi:hypothetical protein
LAEFTRLTPRFFPNIYKAEWRFGFNPHRHGLPGPVAKMSGEGLLLGTHGQPNGKRQQESHNEVKSSHPGLY